jgi:hypothetical protein
VGDFDSQGAVVLDFLWPEKVVGMEPGVVVHICNSSYSRGRRS